MNNVSLIAKLMNENKENWRGYFITNYGKNIRFQEDDNYVTFFYKLGANFSDPVVREARGIIIDKETFDVVCWPFNKFSEWDDKYSDEIDWSTEFVEEKIDGSLIKLWFDKRLNDWRFSTHKQINDNQPANTE